MKRTLILVIAVLLLSSCSLFQKPQVELSPEKQQQKCHQIKQAMGDLQMSSQSTQVGGVMPTTQASLIDEYSRYNCDEVAGKI